MTDLVARLTAVGPWTLCNQLSQGWVPMWTSAPTKRETVLLVHAHPLAGSFSGAIASAVRRGLEAGGKDVVDVSLYADGFEPRLSADERRRYLGPTAQDPAPRPSPAIPRDVAPSIVSCLEHVGELGIVSTDPTYDAPEVLEGWLDRALVPGVAWRLPRIDPPDAVVPGGLVSCLEHVGELGIVSTDPTPCSSPSSSTRGRSSGRSSTTATAASAQSRLWTCGASSRTATSRNPGRTGAIGKTRPRRCCNIDRHDAVGALAFLGDTSDRAEG